MRYLLSSVLQSALGAVICVCFVVPSMLVVELQKLIERTIGPGEDIVCRMFEEMIGSFLGEE